MDTKWGLRNMNSLKHDKDWVVTLLAGLKWKCSSLISLWWHGENLMKSWLYKNCYKVATFLWPCVTKMILVNRTSRSERNRKRRHGGRTKEMTFPSSLFLSYFVVFFFFLLDFLRGCLLLTSFSVPYFPPHPLLYHLPSLPLRLSFQRILIISLRFIVRRRLCGEKL